MDGKYAGGKGFGPYMSIAGDKANIDTGGGRIFELSAKGSKEKLILTNGDLTFVYVKGLDEKTLECASDSCKGWMGLGHNGMPRNWYPVQ